MSTESTWWETVQPAQWRRRGATPVSRWSDTSGDQKLRTEGWVGGDREEWPMLSQFKRLLLQMGRSGGGSGGAMSHKLTEANNLIVFKCDSGLLKINKHESICAHH